MSEILNRCCFLRRTLIGTQVDFYRRVAHAAAYFQTTLSSSLLASLDVHLLFEDAAVVAVPTRALRSPSAAVGASRPEEIFDSGWSGSTVATFLDAGGAGEALPELGERWATTDCRQRQGVPRTQLRLAVLPYALPRTRRWARSRSRRTWAPRPAGVPARGARLVRRSVRLRGPWRASVVASAPPLPPPSAWSAHR